MINRETFLKIISIILLSVILGTIISLRNSLPDIETVDNLSEPETEDDGYGTSIEAKNEMEDIGRQQEINEAVSEGRVVK